LGEGVAPQHVHAGPSPLTLVDLEDLSLVLIRQRSRGAMVVVVGRRAVTDGGCGEGI
jgi:hypothetical protein